MKQYFLFLFFVLLGVGAHAQYEGRWYVLRPKGLTGYFFQEEKWVTIEHLDSLGSRPRRIADTTFIQHRIEKNGFVYLVGRNNYDMPKFMKTKNVNKNSFISYQLVLPQNASIQFNTEADILAYVEHDTLPCLELTAYSHDSITQATYLRPLQVATAYEFGRLLDTLLVKHEALRAFAKKHLDGTAASVMYLLSLVRGDVERGSYLQENFSPFSTKKDFQSLVEKYGSDPDIAQKLERIRGR